LLLHQQEPYWQTGKRQQVEQLLTPEIENIRATWRWAVAALEDPAHSVPELVEWLNLALVSLYYLYESRGWFQEGAAAFGWAIAALEELAGPEGQPQHPYGRLLVRYGRLAIFLGQYEKAQDVLEKALLHLQTGNNVKELSLCHSYLAMVAIFQGQYQRAIAETNICLQQTREINHLPGMAFAENLRGTLAHRQGEYETARVHYEASLQLHRQLEDQYGTAVALNNLGNLANARREFAIAQQYYEESQLIFKEIGHKMGRAATLGNAGVVAVQLGDLHKAHQLTEESLILKQGLGNRHSVCISLINLGEVTCMLGQLDASRRAFREALRLTLELQAEPLTLDALTGLALLLAQDGQPEQAARLLHTAATHPASTRETRERAGQRLTDLNVSATAPAALEDLAELVTEVLRPYT
jgi:tetratricopeptide (TPR) repeat protein